MQVLLIGESSLPPRNEIARLLDFNSRIQRSSLDLSTEENSIAQRFAHCFIYIDRSPNRSLIDKLQDTKIGAAPLILIADTDYRSELYIPLDSLSDDGDGWKTFSENLLALVSLYGMEYQADLLSLVMHEEVMRKIERFREDPLGLERSLSSTTGDEATHGKENKEHSSLSVVHGIATNKLDQFHDTKDLCTFKKLSDDHKKLLAHVCDGVSKGQRHKKIYRDLNMSKSSYYRAFDFFRFEFGTTTNDDVIEKVMTISK